MVDHNDTLASAGNPIQTVQTGSFQEVQTGNMPLGEGYQPLPLERKGYQPTETPPLQSPPQSISGIFPFVGTPGDGNTAVPITPATPNTTIHETTQQSK